MQPEEEVATPTYLVECFWPEITEDQAKDALVRIAGAPEEVGAANQVRVVGCILVPSDGMALFLFVAPSAASVEEARNLIQLPFDRVVESYQIGLGICTF